MLSANLTDYRLLGLVGQGQFAQVYCAIHRHTGQIVAIKQTRHVREQTSQEAFILPKLAHPNVVECYAIALDGNNCGNDYRFILEYCESGTLRNYLDAFSPLPLTQAKSLIIDVLSGLSHVHENAIVHGDLKPENILLTQNSKGTDAEESDAKESDIRQLIAKLSDFGSARSIHTLSPAHLREIGSPTYTAPERFEGKSSYTTDLYSVGVMLYEMLLGDRPFSGPPQVLRHAHTHTQPFLPPTLSPTAAQLLSTALHKDPNQRFPTAQAMLSAVHQLSELYSSGSSSSGSGLRNNNHSILSNTLTEQALTPLSSPHPVETLISVNKGCCIKTESTLHLINQQQQLSNVTPLEDDIQIAVETNLDWIIAFKKETTESKNSAQQGQFISLKREQPSRFIHFNSASPIATSPLTADIKTLQVLALNNRYLLRVRTSQENSQTQNGKTFLEGFTRRGQFIGQYILNLALKHVALTPTPYQLIACPNTTNAAQPCAAIITLKPFQLRYLPCPSQPQCACATDWGYVVVCQGAILFFDRASNLIKTLANNLHISAIAALTSHQILLATPKSNISPLQLLHLDQLGLDIIF